MTTLSDNFAVDTGQLTGIVPTGWVAGTETITGGQLLLTAASSGGIIGGIAAYENLWTIPAPSLLVEAAPGLPSWTQPLTSGNAHFGCGIFLDANNFILFELGPDSSSTSFNLFIFAIIAGTTHTIATASIPNSSLPDNIAFGLVNNIVTAYVSFGGTFQPVTNWSGGFGTTNINVASFYDFTAGGALTGWFPGVLWGQINHAGTINFGVAEIQYVQPFASPITNATVPSVLGDTQSTATTAITGAGLVLGAVTTAASVATPGTVINQNPVGGSSVALGTAVDIVLAVAAPTTVVPDLTNTSLAVVAPGLLAAASLVIGGISDMPSGTIIAGNIISQSPVGGTTVLVGSAVNVVVSSGLPALTVPDLFGLTQDQAITLLLSLGLVPGAIGSAPSKFVPPGEVQAQNPTAGAPVAVGTIVSFVLSQGTPVAGTLFDFEATVISQYANSPTIMQLCNNLNQYIDQSANFANFYNFVWNVDTAVGFGLDIWGKIVGVSRLLQIPNSTAYVGFYQSTESQPAQDWTPAGSDQDNPPVGGAFYTGHNATEAYLLDDASYRQLILAKAFANICTTTAPAINQILQNLYGPGTAWVLNTGPMAISYNLSFTPTAIQLAILEQSGVIPTPLGVSVVINTNV